MGFERQQSVWLRRMRCVGWLAVVALLGQATSQAELIRRANTTFRYPDNPQLFDYQPPEAEYLK